MIPLVAITVRAAVPVKTCPGQALESGLLADCCHNCARQGLGGGLKPLAQFVEAEDWVGWRCVNQVEDRPEAPVKAPW